MRRKKNKERGKKKSPSIQWRRASGAQRRPGREAADRPDLVTQRKTDANKPGKKKKRLY